MGHPANVIASIDRTTGSPAKLQEKEVKPFCGVHSSKEDMHSDPFARADGEVTQEKSFSFGANTGSLLRALGAQQGGSDSIRQPYLENPWVYACINAIVRAVNSVPMLIRTSDDPESDIVTSGALFDLFRRPNPLLTQRKTLRLQTVYHFLHGEVFWFLSKRQETKEGLKLLPMDNKGLGQIEVPDEMWIVAGNIVEMVQDENSQLPVAWEYQGASGKKVSFPAHSVLHLHEVDPYSPLRGVGPMTAAMRTVAQDFASERFNEALLANGGQPNGVFKSKSGQLSPAERQMLKESHQANNGDPQRHRTPIVLGADVDFTPHAWSPQDMEFRELKVWLRDTIMAVFGVTKPVIGITDDVNRSNAQEAMRAFWEVTVIPYLDFLTDELNNGFLSRIVGPESGYRMFFDTAAVDALRESADEKIGRVTSLMGVGRSFNESASMADMEIEEDVEGGDERYVPSSWTRVDEDAPEETPQEIASDPANEESDDTSDANEEEASKSAHTARKARDRTARAKIANQADEDLAPVVASMTKSVKRTIKDFALAARFELREYAGVASKSGETVEKATSSEIERVLRRLLRKTAGTWADSFIRAVDPGYRGAFKVGADSVSAVTGGTSITVDIPDFAAALVQRKKEALAQVSKTLQEEIFQLVSTVLSEASPLASESVRALLERTAGEWSPRINKLVKEAAFRAERIARTETTSIANWTRVQQMKEDGTERHEWITNDDEFVRSKHSAIDGKIVDVGKEFSPGLKFPGDEDAPMDQIINCRCTLNPVVEDIEDEDE